MKSYAIAALAVILSLATGCVPILISAAVSESKDKKLVQHQALVQEQIVMGNAEASGYHMPSALKEEYATEIITGAGAAPSPCSSDLSFGADVTLCGIDTAPDPRGADPYGPQPKPPPPIRARIEKHIRGRLGSPQITMLTPGAWQEVSDLGGSWRVATAMIDGKQVMRIYTWRVDRAAHVAITYPH